MKRSLKLSSAMAALAALGWMFVQSAYSQSTVFLETMGTVGGTTSLAAHEAANGFDNDAFTMTGGGATSNADVRSTSVSAGYTNSAGNAASGSANIFFTAGSERGFAIEGINTAPYSDLTIEFGYRKEAAGSNALFAVQWSTNSGANWNSITLSNMPAANAGVAWYLISGALPPEAAHSSLRLRWLRDSVTANSMRIDDVLVRGNSATAPEVIVTTADGTVPFSTTTIDVEGTANSNVIGELTWTNALTGLSGTIPASAAWTVSVVSLNIGTNLITVRGTNGTGLASQDSVTITRSPAISTNVLFTASSASIGEAGGTYTVTVYKTLASGNVSGSVALGGTATEGVDFTIDTTNFTMNGATTSATFIVTIVDDGDTESSETVILSLTNVVDGTIASPSAFTLTITDNDAPPPPPPLSTNVILYQRFEAGDPWTILEGAGLISSEVGATDTPASQRIQQGANSWQLNLGNATLHLAQVSIAGYTNRAIRARVSSTSTNGTNGADSTDFLRFYVSLDGGAFPADNAPAAGLSGNSNARWGYWATNLIDVSAISSNLFPAPQAGTSSNNYSTVILRIPDAYTSVALRVSASNNVSAEVWNLDNIELLGDATGSGYSPEQTAYIVTHWGSVGGYTGDAADDDGDGYFNVEEFIAGTIPVPPTGSNSFFRVTSITNGPSRYVSVSSVTGRLYRLLSTPELSGTQNWTVVAGPTAGTGGALSLTDGVDTNRSALRVTVEMAP